jgi:uncharacterized membrane protein
MMQRVTKTFVAGLLAALPLALTLTVIIWLADFIHDRLGPNSAIGKLLGSIGLKFVTGDTMAYVIGVSFSLLSIYLLGALVEAGLKTRWHALVDNVMNRLPLVSTIYQALKKLMRMFELKDQSELGAMSSVMCHFGGRGGTAVLALMPSPERIQLHGNEYYGVLIPTAPVPFGGAILYVPVDWVEPLDLAFEELFNVYMSMGATSHECLKARSASQTGRESQDNISKSSEV